MRSAESLGRAPQLRQLLLGFSRALEHLLLVSDRPLLLLGPLEVDEEVMAVRRRVRRDLAVDDARR